MSHPRVRGRLYVIWVPSSLVHHPPGLNETQGCALATLVVLAGDEEELGVDASGEGNEGLAKGIVVETLKEKKLTLFF